MCDKDAYVKELEDLLEYAWNRSGRPSVPHDIKKHKRWAIIVKEYDN